MVNAETAHGWDTAGERIRLARESAKMSVRELSRRIGVSASHVSQVERGLASFSVHTLYKVVSVLGISMDSLFEEVVVTDGDGVLPSDEVVATLETTPLDESGIVLRRTDRPMIKLDSGPRWERLTPKPEFGAEFIEVNYEAATTGEPPQNFIRHSGREYGIIVSGVLNAQVGFSEAEMGPGDSIAFDSSIPHRFWNSRDEPVSAVWFVLDSSTQKNLQSVADISEYHRRH